MADKLNSGETRILEWASSVLEKEADAIQKASKKLDSRFVKAVDLLLGCRGKVVVTGLGKSGFIARKIASTLSSTGTTAIFLHPTEALHGDFGMIKKDDCLLAIAFGGETREVLAVSKFAKKQEIPCVSITGNLSSSLSKLSTIVLDGSIEKEADSLGLAPTSSSTLALALGDALAVATMRQRGFTREEFAELHPGGSLGRRLALVSEHMITADQLSSVCEAANFHEVLEAVTHPNYGICPVVGDKGELLGAITDGDLRRALLESGAKALEKKASSLMSRTPKVINPAKRAVDAISIMEHAKITSLFVTEDEPKKLIGLIRLHDLLSEKVI